MTDIVSVIIPLYNQGKYLDETLNSVLNQTYKFIEIIIVNDGSNEQYTLDVIQRISEMKNIVLINKKNGGLSSARNAGIEVANGKYIVTLDSDDKIHPNYVKQLVHILDNSDARIAYSKSMLFGEKKGLWMLPRFSVERILKGNIIFCSAMFYREDWVKIGGYDEKLKTGLEDWDFWLSVIERNLGTDNIAIQHPKPLFYYRIRKNSMLRSIDLSNKKNILEYIYNKHRILFDSNNTRPVLELDNSIITRLLRKIYSKALGGYYNVIG